MVYVCGNDTELRKGAQASFFVVQPSVSVIPVEWSDCRYYNEAKELPKEKMTGGKNES